MPAADAMLAPVPGRRLLIRIGGVAMLVGMLIHILLNIFIKEFPPEDPSPSELQEYIVREASAWSVIHGFRYLAFACIVLFAAGLYARTSRAPAGSDPGWGIVGLLGAGIFVTNGFVTNGIELLAFLHAPPIDQRPDLFWLLFRLSRVLFTAEVVAWSLLIFGFSMAGWRGATLPGWIVIPGMLQTLAGLSAGLLLPSALANGAGTIPLEIATVSGLLWFIATASYLAIRGDAGRRHESDRRHAG